jgi:hexosaminidase
VNYRIPDVLGLESDHLVLVDTAVVTLRSPARATIRYTLDGTEPHTGSPIYTTPLRLAIDRGPVTVTARLHLPDGRLGAPRKAVWRKAVYLSAGRTNATGLAAGLSYAFSTGRADSVAGVSRLAVTSRGTVPAVQLRGDEPGDRWGVTLEGWLRVPSDGIWEFELTSDDGSALWIGDQKVVDHDGYHAAEAKTGMIPLRAGLHRIRVIMFQGGGGKALGLGWRREGAPTFTPIPSTVLFNGR